MTTDELALAFKVKKEIQGCTNYHYLTEKIKAFKEEDAKIEQKYKAQQYIFNKGNFSPYLERMESILLSAKAQHLQGLGPTG